MYYCGALGAQQGLLSQATDNLAHALGDLNQQ